jgi:hypothetical protein
MSTWASAVDQLQSAEPGHAQAALSDQLRVKVMEKVQVKLAAERDDWKDLLQSQGLADRVQRVKAAPVAGGDSPYTQATAARLQSAQGSHRSPPASPPRRQRTARDPGDANRLPTPPASPAGPPPSPPMASDSGRRGRPNRRMAQSLHAAERDDSVPHPRDWRATVRERSPSIESADDDHKFEDVSERDDRRLERARKRGRAAWEQAHVGAPRRVL